MPASRRARIVSTAIVAALLACAWGALGWAVGPVALQHDFLNIYTGASLALEGRFGVLHDPAVQLEYERRLAGDIRVVVPFVRPAAYAAALAPLALIPFRAAFVVWVVLQCLLLGACLAWACRRWGADALLWGMLSLPAALGIAHGQDGPAMLAVACAGYELSRRGRDGLAGAVWSLVLVKFHLWLFLPVALAARRRWGMLRGFACGGLALAGVSIALGGLRGAENYVRLITNNKLERLSPTPENMWNLQGIAANFRAGHAVFFAVAGAAVLLLAAAALRGAPLWRTVAAACTAGLLLVPHVYGYDATALLLPLWLTMSEASAHWTRAAAALFAAPLTPLATLLGKPFAAIPALLLLLWLAALALEGLRSGGPENSLPP